MIHVTEKNILDDISVVVRSNTRFQILSVLSRGQLTPVLIAAQLERAISQISSSLRVLKEKELVVCVNEEAKRGRIYRITAKGQIVHDEIREMIDRVGIEA